MTAGRLGKLWNNNQALEFLEIITLKLCLNVGAVILMSSSGGGNIIRYHLIASWGIDPQLLGGF